MFFTAFIIAEIPEKIRAIHSKIFIHSQNHAGLKTVRNPHKINNIANHNNNQEDRSFISVELK